MTAVSLPAVSDALPTSRHSGSGPAATGLTNAPSIRVLAATTVEELTPHWEAWQALAEVAVDPNPFYEPWMLVPALQTFGQTDRWTVCFAYQDSEKPNQPPVLLGVFPLVQKQLGKLPLRFWTFWQHLYGFCCTPLLKPGGGETAFAAVGEWLRGQGSLQSAIPLWELHHLPAEGGIQHALVNVIDQHNWLISVRDGYQRAFLQRTVDAETYLQNGMTRHQRHELRRQRRRLGETGQLETRCCTAADDLEIWIDQFLKLESAGWKGREQTAISAQPEHRRYFTEIAKSGFARDQVQFIGLFLDDRPIALKCNFISKPGSYAFKIAFDEAYSRYSPGVLLEIDNIEWLHQQPGLEWMDSCAVRNHSMINRIWSERRSIQRVLVSPGSARSDVLLGGIELLTALKTAWRRRNRKKL